MQRTQISLTDRERRLLDDAARRTGRSLSALIRDAVDAAYGDAGDVQEDLAVLRRTAGAWSNREDGEAGDGEEYVEALRSGRRLR